MSEMLDSQPRKKYIVKSVEVGDYTIPDSNVLEGSQMTPVGIKSISEAGPADMNNNQQNKKVIGMEVPPFIRKVYTRVPKEKKEQKKIEKDAEKQNLQTEKKKMIEETKKQNKTKGIL